MFSSSWEHRNYPCHQRTLYCTVSLTQAAHKLRSCAHSQPFMTKNTDEYMHLWNPASVDRYSVQTVQRWVNTTLLSGFCLLFACLSVDMCASKFIHVCVLHQPSLWGCLLLLAPLSPWKLFQLGYTNWLHNKKRGYVLNWHGGRKTRV